MGPKLEHQSRRVFDSLGPKKTIDGQIIKDNTKASSNISIVAIEKKKIITKDETPSLQNWKGDAHG